MKLSLIFLWISYVTDFHTLDFLGCFLQIYLSFYENFFSFLIWGSETLEIFKFLINFFSLFVKLEKRYLCLCPLEAKKNAFENFLLYNYLHNSKFICFSLQNILNTFFVWSIFTFMGRIKVPTLKGANIKSDYLLNDMICFPDFS